MLKHFLSASSSYHATQPTSTSSLGGHCRIILEIIIIIYLQRMGALNRLNLLCYCSFNGDGLLINLSWRLPPA
ncbi:hypothetical protein HAX54_043579 [Datura stramonium]|uniref:Uncharacterized protein n=1 Tax=Datura stramonium TaxID=4076 RepID=A0ABS8SNB1_DATST|nr:hypothetical protein [Datura stramonium]